jgi:hypothetical protein
MKTSVPQTRPPRGNGWTLWCQIPINGLSPVCYVEVETWRWGWMETRLTDPCGSDPYANVAGLWWRPAGPMRPWLSGLAGMSRPHF